MGTPHEGARRPCGGVGPTYRLPLRGRVLVEGEAGARDQQKHPALGLLADAGWRGEVVWL